MKYALVEGTKTEATKGVHGICPSCGSELIAKCGRQKINHWAHKGTLTCDPWWEPETEWHRSWKNNYDIDWQEISLIDEQTGEKHIADVRTDHNLVIEFQHASIKPEERISREKFYKNMVWVVDGTRLKRDFPRFLKGRGNFRSTEKEGIFLVDFPDEVFPESWLNSSVPLIFDFKGLEVTGINDLRNRLFCLLPIRKGRYTIVVDISRKAFIDTTINGDWSLRVQKCIDDLIRPGQEQQKQIEPLQQLKIRRQDSTHYYDPRKGRWVKRRRF